MNEQQKKNTIILVAFMVICVILTSLLLTNSLECSSCEGKITGKYYISFSDSILCKACGVEYYRGWPGDLDNLSASVDNTLRNILIAVEIIGFVVAIIIINKKKIRVIANKENIKDVISNFSPVSKNEETTEKVVSDPVVKRKPEIITDPMGKVETEAKEPTKSVSEVFESGTEPPTIAETKSELRTTFNSRTEESKHSASLEENKGNWFKSAGDL